MRDASSRGTRRLHCILNLPNTRRSWQGSSTIDFGSDYLECKRRWVTSVAGSYRYCHYSGLGKAQLLWAKRYVDAWWRTGHEAATRQTSA